MIELPWDPEVESPATIAIIGGGPVGIETAIYARFLGYHVSIFEARRVAHRMLDWHHRPLSVPIRECTTSLGHAAIKAQNPDYVIPSGDGCWTGHEYAEKYLLPLAKTDLLFDDIHFLSPVIDVSRYQTYLGQCRDLQTRCNDEFRIVVAGQHRGTWISRADILIDCRGCFQTSQGIGPGGGKAIGESEVEKYFDRHSPGDRKFEPKMIRDKSICLIGVTHHAVQYAQEFLTECGNYPQTRLNWIVPEDEGTWTEPLKVLVAQIRSNPTGSLQLLPQLGVEKVQRSETGKWTLQCVKSDESTTELNCDVVVRRTACRWQPLSDEVDSRFFCFENGDRHSFVTWEPGYYRLYGSPSDSPDSDCFESVDGDNQSHRVFQPGESLERAFQSIRELFSVVGGRESLNLYHIMAENIAAGRV